MIMKKQFAFLLVWICSGVTMCAYQTDNKILGFGFTLLSFMYFFILEERDNKLKERKKYIKVRKNNKICNITDEELVNFIVRGRKLYHEASNNEKDCAKKCMSCIYSYVHMRSRLSLYYAATEELLMRIWLKYLNYGQNLILTGRNDDT